MYKAYKYRIYPDEEQKIQLSKTFGCCRFVNNYYLSKRIELYKTDGTTLNYNQCSKDLTELKQIKEWLKEVDKFALQNSLKDLDKAYQNFSEKLRKAIKIKVFRNSKVNITVIRVTRLILQMVI